MRKKVIALFLNDMLVRNICRKIHVLDIQQVAKIVETLHLLGALLIPYYLSHCSPPPPLISVASKTKKCWELKQSTLKGGEGRGSGKGLNSRYGGHWELEKVLFNESVSTILQLVVAHRQLHYHTLFTVYWVS